MGDLHVWSLLAFLGTSGLIVFLYWLLGESSAGELRLGRLLTFGRKRTGVSLSALPQLGAALMPSGEQEHALLRQRLIQAGLYDRSALSKFLGVRVVVLVVAVLAAIVVALTGWLSLGQALFTGAVLVGLALIGPGLWLDARKRQRQAQFRRALPDMLDVLTICLEAGLGLAEAIRRVSEELVTAHPLLAEEMIIVQREMLLGLSAGDALRKFALRCDLPEMRDLASVMLHTERYGVGTASALRVEADAMRLARQQRAEEMAQKAAVKILFPTLLFIFPALFVVVLGPAAYAILQIFASTQ